MPLKYGFSSPFAHFLIEAVMITYSKSQNRFKKIRVSSPLTPSSSSENDVRSVCWVENSANLTNNRGGNIRD